jgi:sulfide:quinone oxidoreductase
MVPSRPLHVLIAGGGVAALEALLALRDLAEERVAIHLVAPSDEFVYRPLEVGAPFALGAVRRYSIEAITASRGAHFRLDYLKRVIAADRTVFLGSGAEVHYDALLVAVGARAVEALPGALTYRGMDDAPAMRRVVAEASDGRARSLAFVVPAGVSWPLPLYELALLTAKKVGGGQASPQIAIVSPEDAPLALFGRAASEEVARLLERSGIAFHGSAYASRVDGDRVLLGPGDEPVVADRVVALPGMKGPVITGLPSLDGFLRTDDHGRVHGCEAVWAAGDVIDFPVKQGGLAAQQADAAAEDLAAVAGAPITPTPFRPVLRGVLLTGGAPRYMRASIAGGAGEDSTVADHALWWPPGKIAGRYLAPHLGAAHEDLSRRRDHGGVPVEVALEREWQTAHPPRVEPPSYRRPTSPGR